METRVLAIDMVWRVLKGASAIVNASENLRLGGIAETLQVGSMSSKKAGGGRSRLLHDGPPPQVTDALDQNVYLSENCAIRGSADPVMVPKEVLLPIGLEVFGLLRMVWLSRLKYSALNSRFVSR